MLKAKSHIPLCCLYKNNLGWSSCCQSRASDSNEGGEDETPAADADVAVAAAAAALLAAAAAAAAGGGERSRIADRIINNKRRGTDGAAAVATSRMQHEGSPIRIFRGLLVVAVASIRRVAGYRGDPRSMHARG